MSSMMQGRAGQGSGHPGSAGRVQSEWVQYIYCLCSAHWQGQAGGCGLTLTSSVRIATLDGSSLSAVKAGRGAAGRGISRQEEQKGRISAVQGSGRAPARLLLL
jgi:hypothetical protein